MTKEEYDTYVQTSLANNTDIPDEVLVKETIGKCVLGLMNPQPPYVRNHDAIPLLQAYAQDGCPVDFGKDWTKEHIELTLPQGPHRSALEKAAVRQL